MVPSLVLALAVAVPAPGTAAPAAPHPGVLDLRLARMASRSSDPARPASATEVRFLARGPDASALVRAIRRLGGTAIPLTSRIVSARLAPGRLAALAQDPALGRAEALSPHRPLLDVSVPEIGADRVRRGEGLPTPVTGRGVVLGLVDTGLDWRHPTFRGDDGTPRVLALWDMDAQGGTPPEGYDRGDLCAHARLVAGGCDPLDLIGHGSHVAATAGGRDRTYTGVAPDVDYLVARSLTFEDLPAAARWIFETAGALGRPAVINMSLGGHYGPHDGTSLEAQALSDLVGPGRILVVAAGNEGDTPIHLAYDLGAEPGRTELVVAPGFGASGGLVDLWAEPGAAPEVRVALLGPDEAEVAATEFVGPEGAVDLALSGEAGPLGRVWIAWEPASPLTGKLRANVSVRPSDAPDTWTGNAAGLTWVLEVRGRGRFDAWTSGGGLLAPGAAFGTREGGAWRPGDSRSTVAMPGTAPGALTVAAYDTRGTWDDLDGTPHEDPMVHPGALAFFSSRGPALDPARTGLKPELAAPGEWIAAPFGQNTPSFSDAVFLAEDVVAMRGTSMAAPHVAGTVALLLELDPTLGPEEVEAVLAGTARHDGFTGPGESDGWGYGKLDAFAAVQALLGVPEAGGGDGAGGCGCTAAGGSDAGAAAALGVLLALARRRRRWGPAQGGGPQA